MVKSVFHKPMTSHRANTGAGIFCPVAARIRSVFSAIVTVIAILLATLCIYPTSIVFAHSEGGKHTYTVGFLVGVSGLGDQSYNDMAYAGLFKVKQEHNIHLIFEDSVKDDQAFESAILRLLEKKSDIIVANGFYMKELVEKYAPLHPETYFIQQDAAITDIPNVVSILYSVNEGSFLVGALAGLMTKSNKVGFIGGVDIPIMHVFRLGFREGVHHVKPEIALTEQFITIAPDFTGFKKPSDGYSMAMDTYERGIDIIFSAAGLSGNGVLQAAKKSGKYAIGVDSDQDHLAEGHVLTSMMKRLDVAIYTEVNKIIHGKFKPGIVTYGLKENGVGLSPMRFTKHLFPQHVLSRLKNIERQIIEGSITVPHYLDQNR